MMEKEFEINDILNAMTSISKKDKKERENAEKKDLIPKKDILNIRDSLFKNIKHIKIKESNRG